MSPNNAASSCLRKIGYDSGPAARLAIRSMKSKGKPTNKLRVYRCQFGCGKFHIGTRDQKKKWT